MSTAGSVEERRDRRSDSFEQRITVIKTAALNDPGLKMTIPPKMRDLARCLIEHEAAASKTSEPAESTPLRVYEKLRRSLGAFAGVDGFQSLASRALTQAKSEAPGLWAAKVAADGSLHGLGESRRQLAELEPQLGSDKDQASDEGVILIACLLGLLFIFLGEASTLSLLRTAWPGATFDDRSSENGRES